MALILHTVIYKWKNWEYLNNVEGGEEDDEDSWLLTKMFHVSFSGTVAKEMLPKIETAIAINTIAGYKKLDEEWGKDKLNNEGKIEFDADRDYFGVWNTLRDYLKEEKDDKSDNYNKLKTEIIENEGKVFWDKLEAQIESNKKDK